MLIYIIELFVLKINSFLLTECLYIFIDIEGGIGVTPLMSVFGELTARMTDSKMVSKNI